MIDNSDAVAAALRQIGRGFLELAEAVSGNVAGKEREAREIAVLREFPDSREQGFSRAQASAAFKKHGLNPQSIGVWTRRGFLQHQEDRRWLGPRGRERLEVSGS